MTARQVYLPAGELVRLVHGRGALDGGRSYVVAPTPMDRIPLYARGGAVIPMWPEAPPSTDGYHPDRRRAAPVRAAGRRHYAVAAAGGRRPHLRRPRRARLPTTFTVTRSATADAARPRSTATATPSSRAAPSGSSSTERSPTSLATAAWTCRPPMAGSCCPTLGGTSRSSSPPDPPEPARLGEPGPLCRYDQPTHQGAPKRAGAPRRTGGRRTPPPWLFPRWGRHPARRAPTQPGRHHPRRSV